MNQPWSSLAVPPDAIIGVLNAVFQVPGLPDTSLCEAQGDGGGPAISCRLSRERQIGREDRRKIDMMFVEPPAANLACEIAMSRAAIGPWMLQSNSRPSSVVICRILRGLSAANPGEHHGRAIAIRASHWKGN